MEFLLAGDELGFAICLHDFSYKFQRWESSALLFDPMVLLVVSCNSFSLLLQCEMPRYDDRDRDRDRYGGNTRLYVGRLSSRTRTRDLEDLFGRYGR
jgi:hypothetical protein